MFAFRWLQRCNAVMLLPIRSPLRDAFSVLSTSPATLSISVSRRTVLEMFRVLRVRVTSTST